MTMRSRFYRVAAEALDDDERVAIVLADIGAAQLPQHERIHNVGIREQLMIGVAAGLALEGYRPVVHSYTPFLVERPYEQIKLDLGHQDVGAVLVSTGASYDARAKGGRIRRRRTSPSCRRFPAGRSTSRAIPTRSSACSAAHWRPTTASTSGSPRRRTTPRRRRRARRPAPRQRRRAARHRRRPDARPHARGNRGPRRDRGLSRDRAAVRPRRSPRGAPRHRRRARRAVSRRHVVGRGLGRTGARATGLRRTAPPPLSTPPASRSAWASDATGAGTPPLRRRRRTPRRARSRRRRHPTHHRRLD